MSYTIDYTYNKVLEAIDKDGSDFFNIPRIMRAFESATYDLIEEEYESLGKNQKITDTLKPLYKAFPSSVGGPSVYDLLIPVIINSFVLPSDYLHLIDVKTVSANGVQSRRVKIIPFGKLETFIANPNTRPNAIYPILVLNSNTMSFYSDSDNVASYSGFYLKKPTFGNYGGNTASEIVLDLEDFVVEKIIKITANDLLLTIGDPRAEGKYRQEKQFGKV